MTAKSFRLALRSLFVGAFVICAVPAEADTIFWLQNTPIAATPAPLKFNSAPGSTGTLYLFGSSDTTRVGSYGFDIVSSNSNALSFTGPATYGPQSSTAWTFTDGPTAVTADSVQHLGGAAFPGIGQGFGPGSSIGNTMLLASVGFKAGSGFNSALSLRVNDYGVTDYDGEYLNFHVGSLSSTTLNGEDIGASAAAGTYNGCLCGVYVSSEVFKNVNPGSPGFVDYTFQTSGDLPMPGPVTFDGIDGPYYGGPKPLNRDDIKPATFDLSTGKFHWDTTGALAGNYTWFVGASAQGYTGQGLVQIQIIPEPPSLALLVGMSFIFSACRCRSGFGT